MRCFVKKAEVLFAVDVCDAIAPRKEKGDDSKEKKPVI